MESQDQICEFVLADIKTRASFLTGFPICRECLKPRSQNTTGSAPLLTRLMASLGPVCASVCYFNVCLSLVSITAGLWKNKVGPVMRNRQVLIGFRYSIPENLAAPQKECYLLLFFFALQKMCRRPAHFPPGLTVVHREEKCN